MVRRVPNPDFGTIFDGVAGTVTIRELAPCSLPFDLGNGVKAFDAPAVLAASIEESDADNGLIAQLGYYECRAGFGIGGLDCDNGKHFVYTLHDNTSGAAVDADSWAGTPQMGDKYKFRILRKSSPTDQWEYCIMNVTDGTGYNCILRPRHWESKLVWWGAENQNTMSAHATLHFSPPLHINMYGMDYNYLGAAPWWHTTQNAVQRYPNPNHPARWNATIYDAVDANEDGVVNDDDGFRADTTDSANP